MAKEQTTTVFIPSIAADAADGSILSTRPLRGQSGMLSVLSTFTTVETWEGDRGMIVPSSNYYKESSPDTGVAFKPPNSEASTNPSTGTNYEDPAHSMTPSTTPPASLAKPPNPASPTSPPSNEASIRKLPIQMIAGITAGGLFTIIAVVSIITLPRWMKNRALAAAIRARAGATQSQMNSDSEGIVSSSQGQSIPVKEYGTDSSLGASMPMEPQELRNDRDIVEMAGY